MALKEYNEVEFEKLKLISTQQAEEKFDERMRGIKVVYVNDELDGEYSSQLSSDDWDLLKLSIDRPEYNEKLAALLKMESIFD